MLVVGLFAAIALALAAVGIYGVMAGLVEPTRGGESDPHGARCGRCAGGVGDRPHHGAGRRLRIRRAASWARWRSRLLGALLYEIGPSDPATLAATLGVLMVVAFLASYLPARRASRIRADDRARAE